MSLASLDVWEVIGWTSNACYFSRFFVQWLASERAAKIVVPVLFWWLSLFGVTGLALYSHSRGEPVIMAGAVINGLIYLRNLMLVYQRSTFRLGTISTSALGLVAIWLILRSSTKLPEGLSRSPYWLACSIVGQGLWSSRFVLQWWWAEREQRTDFPRAFWWISLAGNLLLLSYSIHQRDAVLIAGFTPGPFLQVRNLMIAYRKRPVSAGALEGPSRLSA